MVDFVKFKILSPIDKPCRGAQSSVLVHVEVTLQDALLERIWLSPLWLLGFDSSCLGGRCLHLRSWPHSFLKRLDPAATRG